MLHWKIDGMRRGRRLVAMGVLVALAFASGGLVVLAQTQQKEFEPFTGTSADSMPAGPLVTAAYAFVWVALMGYVFMLWRRIGRVERELADVTARLAKRPSGER